MVRSDIVIVDSGTELRALLGRLVDKWSGLGWVIRWVTSVAEAHALVRGGRATLVVYSDRVTPEETRRLKSLKTTTAVVFGTSGRGLAAAAQNLFGWIQAGVLAWRHSEAEQRLNKFLQEKLLPLRRGQIVHGYKIGACLGRGGFGSVFLATEVATGRRVAVKIVTDYRKVRQELGSLRKYVNLAQEHPHLAKILYPTFAGDALFLVMPLADLIVVDGVKQPADLQALLLARGTFFSDVEALNILRQILCGLHSLHSAGLSHGDPSLRNIIRVNGIYVLSDPGLVRFLGDKGIYANAAFYPSPATGTASDDLYALAVVGFALTRGLPRELNALQLERLGKSSAPLGRIIARACNRLPEKRYASAATMLQDVERALTVIN